MPTYRLTPPGDLVQADSLRDEGRTVALIGTALVMNRPRDIVIRRVPSNVLVKIVGEPGAPPGPCLALGEDVKSPAARSGG